MNNYYENYDIRSAAQLQPATARCPAAPAPGN